MEFTKLTANKLAVALRINKSKGVRELLLIQTMNISQNIESSLNVHILNIPGVPKKMSFSKIGFLLTKGHFFGTPCIKGIRRIK